MHIANANRKLKCSVDLFKIVSKTSKYVHNTYKICDFDKQSKHNFI